MLRFTLSAGIEIVAVPWVFPSTHLWFTQNPAQVQPIVAFALDENEGCTWNVAAWIPDLCSALTPVM